MTWPSTTFCTGTPLFEGCEALEGGDDLAVLRGVGDIEATHGPAEALLVAERLQADRGRAAPRRRAHVHQRRGYERRAFGRVHHLGDGRDDVWVVHDDRFYHLTSRPCPPGDTCDGTCVDRQSDPANCGGCNAACPEGVACVAGACACPGAQEVCAGECTDVQSDFMNCGACGKVCDFRLTCTAGTCACPTPQTLCGAACTDTQSDAANCGTCGHACLTDGVCSAGACGCPAGDAVCGSACSDPLTDASNCGQCGQACVGACDGGACVGAVSVQASDESTCALLAGGVVRCWGLSVDGALGGSSLSSDVPGLGGHRRSRLRPPLGHDPRLLGREHLRRARRWDDNRSGRADPRARRVRRDPDSACGTFTTCALLAGGSASCWGAGAGYGTLGNGGHSDSLTPVTVSGSAVLTEVAVSTEGFHACALVAGGTVECWGDNGKGQAGPYQPGMSLWVPAAVTGVTGAVHVTTGADHTCALLGDGTVQCWGSGAMGQLGNGMSGTTYQSPTPVAVTGLSQVQQISAGNQHTCAVRADGSVWCWGANDNGQLGNGLTTNSAVPVRVVWWE